jgi:hypothetical protein
MFAPTWLLFAALSASVTLVDVPAYGPLFKQISSGLSTEELAIIEEYRANYSRLVQVYENAQIDAILKESNVKAYISDDNPDGRGQASLSYRSTEPRLFRLDIDRQDWRTGGMLGDTTVIVRGPQKGFIARRKDGHGLAIVKELSVDIDPIGAMLDYGFIRAAYSFSGRPLAWMIFDNDAVSDWRPCKKSCVS